MLSCLGKCRVLRWISMIEYNENYHGILLFVQIPCVGKFLFSSSSPKWIISTNCRILCSWVSPELMDVIICCMQADIHKGKKLILLPYTGVVMLTQVCQNVRIFSLACRLSDECVASTSVVFLVFSASHIAMFFQQLK